MRRCRSLRSRCPRSALPQTRNHVVMTCDYHPTSLGGDTADCASRDRLRHFRLQSPAGMEVDGGVGGPVSMVGRYSCQLYRGSFVDDCDICRPHRAAADGSPTPPTSTAELRHSNGAPPGMSPDGPCDVIKTVTSSSTTGNGITTPAALECPECLAESGRTFQSPLSSDNGSFNNTVGPLAGRRHHPCSTISV